MIDSWLNPQEEVWQLSLVYLLVALLGLASAVEAIYKTRTAQGAAAWAVALISMPLLTVPLYWVFGRRKFRGYVKARKLEKQGVRLQIARVLKNLKPCLVTKQAGALEKIVQSPFTKGNRIDLLIDGEQTFKAMFAAIAEAKDYVLLEFYIVRDDQIGNQLKQLLCEKAAEGVAIYFLFDEIGSFQLSKTYLSQLNDAGVEIYPFNSTKGWKNRFQLNFRNHRKILIVDGLQGFVGGINVGDEYLGRDKKFSPWRDTQVKIQGPVVISLQVAFMEDWYWAREKILKLNWQPKIMVDENQHALVMASGPADVLETCELAFQQVISSARQRLWIISPYFVPDPSTIHCLQLAALRGVDVRIMLPKKADNLLVQLSSHAYLREALQTGIKLFRYNKGFLHQKVILVDDDLASVGSANMDNRSFRLNFEANIIVRDQHFANQLATMLEEDFIHSDEIDYQQVLAKPLWFQFVVKLARLLAPIQ